jgi:hypothetical protein
VVGEDRIDRRRKRLEHDLERARHRFETTRREDYASDAVFRRVRTQRRQRAHRLEQWLATMDAEGTPVRQPEGRALRGAGCPRCGEPRNQLFSLAGAPAALCYGCWAELGRVWWEQHGEGVNLGLGGAGEQDLTLA